MTPVFSIVIPAFNSRSALELVLRCIEAQELPRERFECLIVDDGSKDGTSEFLQGYQSGINWRYFSHPVNQGRSQARNTACTQAGGDFLLFLDADMLPEPDWLTRYALALDMNPALDVLSGGRYHVHLGANPEERPQVLGQMLGMPPEALFLDQVPQQFDCLRTNARLGMYPGYAMAKVEAQLPDICKQYPSSLLCAYTVITSNVAVRRSAFEKIGGFDPSMRRTEDTDLGVRLWEIGARFGCAPDARAYHMYHANQGDRKNVLVERQSFFYRHPYQLIILLFLWFAYHDRPDPNPPSPIFESLLTLLAAGPDLADIDVGQEFSQIYRQRPWAECVCDRDFLVTYFTEHTNISPRQVNVYLDQAIERGVVTHRREQRYYFDLEHITNWILRCTPYQQYELEHTRYSWIRDWIPNPQAALSPAPAGNTVSPKNIQFPLRRPPLSFHCRGIYEVNIPRQALPDTAWQATLNLPLPVAHACQSDVQILRCEPTNLLDYADDGRTMISGFPLEHGVNESGDIRVRYEFECNLREYLLAKSEHETTSIGSASPYLKPTYAPNQLSKAEAILKKIFTGPTKDAYSSAQEIYHWILNNKRYRRSLLADAMVMETGFGPCFHLARLFVNLCRLIRIPAREQCGAMLNRVITPDHPQRTLVTERTLSVLGHTWAEFYTPRYGWVPVEFSATSFGRHVLTATNVEDQHLRQQLIAETDLYSNYYFGNLDPFRIFTSEKASQTLTYPLVQSQMQPEALKLLMLQTRHRLLCDLSGTATFDDLRDDLQTVSETFAPSLAQHQQITAAKDSTRNLDLAPADEDRPGQRIVITSIGSTGDVQPLLGLAEELGRQRHEITFALPATYRQRVEKLGFRFVEIGAGTGVDAWHEIFARQAEIPDPVEQTRYFVETLAPWLPQMHRELCDICTDADMLISPAFQLAARMAHDTTGIPFVSVHLSPFGSKGGKAVREVSAPVINRVRQAARLLPLEDPLGADAASPQLALYAVSPRVFRPPAGWPAQAHLTGYWFFDEQNWQPTPALVEFLQAGSPPVVISFGSMPNADPEALTDLILAGVQQAGCRAIIQRGGGGLARRQSLPENVYAVDFVPHTWLFSRAGCVVHHGGAGTTAAAFRAGVPTVVVPHLLDQPIWAEYARAFGCAGAVIPHERLTAEKFGTALSQTLSNARFQRAATRLGEQIRAESGVETARQLIEKEIATRKGLS